MVGYYEQMDVTTNSGNNAFISSISFTWKYMLCRFSFLVMEKSWKINVEKEGSPCLLRSRMRTLSYNLGILVQSLNTIEPQLQLTLSNICVAAVRISTSRDR